MSRLQITIGQAFLPLLHFTDPFIMVESPRGCLKTCSILHILMSRAARWPGKRWYLWQSTRTLLSTTVLPSFEKYVIPAWAEVRGMRLLNPNARPSQRTEYLFENGSVFTPVGLDDLLRGTSSEGAGGYLAEAVQLDNRDQATALVGMMREPGVPFHQIIVDTNPGAPAHWTNTTSEDINSKLRRVTSREDYQQLQTYNATPAVDPIKGKWKRIVAKIMDNPFYFDADAWKMRPEGEAYLRGLGTLSGWLHARWVLGDWKAAEGSVFPEFDQDRNVCDPFPGGWPREWPCWLGYDSGYDHPSGLVWYGLAPNGQPYIFDDLLRAGMNLDETAEHIKSRLPGRNVVQMMADPRRTFSRTDLGNGVTIAEHMHKAHGLRFVPYPRKEGAQCEQQVEAVRLLLRDPERPLQVWRTCKGTIMELSSWSYKRKTDGSQPAGDDAFEDKNNDIIDPLLGIVASNPKFAPSPAWSFS